LIDVLHRAFETDNMSVKIYKGDTFGSILQI